MGRRLSLGLYEFSTIEGGLFIPEPTTEGVGLGFQGDLTPALGDSHWSPTKLFTA